MRPFTTDGCSGLFMRAVHWWWRATGRELLAARVRALCVEHDRAYHPGGTAVQRVVADALLAIGVANLGQPLLARCMILGLGVGGHPLWPLPWRWGYGESWPKRYARPRSPILRHAHHPYDPVVEMKGTLVFGDPVLCSHTYRRWDGAAWAYDGVTCPYTGPAVGSPEDDRCGKTLADCKVRFPRDIHFRAFPRVPE